MKINSPLGVLEFSDLLQNYGYKSIDDTKPLRKLQHQTFEDGKEVLWYRDKDNRPITYISIKKNNPLQYVYSCKCGYRLESSFNIDSIRCYMCNELLDIDKIG